MLVSYENCFLDCVNRNTSITLTYYRPQRTVNLIYNPDKFIAGGYA